MILQAFVAGMPAKIVVQTDDLLEQSPITGELLFSGLRGRQLASTAIGFGTCYVLQSSSSSLFQLREQILRGLAYRRAGIVQHLLRRERNRAFRPIWRPPPPRNRGRFPAFTYDPSAGAGLGIAVLALTAIRKSISIGRCSGSTMKTRSSSSYRKPSPSRFVDFMACDPRCAKHFAEVPRAKWDDDLRAGCRISGAPAEGPVRKGAVPVDGRRRQSSAKSHRQRQAGARGARVASRRGAACRSSAAFTTRMRPRWSNRSGKSGPSNRGRWPRPKRSRATLPRHRRRRPRPAAGARRRRSGARKTVGRSLYRDGPLHELQRMHADQRQDVRL